MFPQYFSWSFPKSVGFILHVDINPFDWIHLKYPSSRGSDGWHITAPCQPWHCSISANHFLFWCSREAISGCFLSWTLNGSSMLRPVKLFRLELFKLNKQDFSLEIVAIRLHCMVSKSTKEIQWSRHSRLKAQVEENPLTFNRHLCGGNFFFHSYHNKITPWLSERESEI